MTNITRFSRLFLAVLSILLATPTFASTTKQQWTLVAKSESAPNAIPVQYDSNGNPINCSHSDPDKVSSGDCYNPLIITFDLNAPTNSNWGPVNAATLNGQGYSNLLSLTNSIGSNDGGVSSITVKLQNGTYTIVVTNEDGSVFTFTASCQIDPMPGNFTSTGGSSSGDHGQAQVYNDIVTPTGTYDGQFDNTTQGSGTPTANDNISVAFGSVQPLSNFSPNTVTVTPNGSGNTCFTRAMTTADSLAQTYGPSYVSGDVTILFVGDGRGNVIALIVTPDSDASGVFTSPDTTSTLYFSFYGLAGTCAGYGAHDAPFHHVKASTPKRPPIRFTMQGGRLLLGR